ncbi:MAG: protein-arginine deiminase [Myxococcales bacterium]|nr:protein-arginine deiminase [Myxococcales bacterium]
MRRRTFTYRLIEAIKLAAWGLAVTSLALTGCSDTKNNGGTGGNTAGDITENDVSTSNDTTESGDIQSGDGSINGADSADTEPSGNLEANLLTDNNRNGQIDLDDPTEDNGEEDWGETNGAIVLANIDDDQETCKKFGTDVALAACNDAADEVINGEDDVKDMAPVHIVALPSLPDGYTGRISVDEPSSSMVRFFKPSANGLELFDFANQTFTTEELKSGIELRLEAKDIVRDIDVWNGYISVKFALLNTDAQEISSDSAVVRVSPVMLYHHLLPAEKMYVTSFNDKDSVDFRTDLQTAMDAASKSDDVVPMFVGDQWTQDFFETGYASMPGPGGIQHVMRVNYRSANVYNASNKTNPLRPAGQVVFSMLRGKDSAGVQHYDLQHNGYMDSLNSFGNTETVPPYTKDGVEYPLGRVFRGSVPNFFPDPKFSKMLESQLIQPPIYVDTSWLLVGHVDETITFLRADSPRGWVIAANDAALAKQMLEDAVASGHGDTPMFVGKYWDQNDPAEITINGVLADKDVMADSAEAIVEVDDQIEILKEETGITDEEILKIPFLHYTIQGYSVAYQPGTVNGLVIDGTHYASPKPHGPNIDGVDIFEEQMTEELAKIGMTVHYVENWNLYHALLGEVHCGTNTTREIPTVKWWETGR